jgi:hypothetical protein
MNKRNRNNDENNKSSISKENESEELTKINFLLRELSLQKNRVRAISKFEKWYKCNSQVVKKKCQFFLFNFLYLSWICILINKWNMIN